MGSYIHVKCLHFLLIDVKLINFSGVSTTTEQTHRAWQVWKKQAKEISSDSILFTTKEVKQISLASKELPLVVI